MDYELAKELKEAGYKIPTLEYCGHDLGIERVPTLSELIEACGDRFDTLRLSDDGLWYCGHIVMTFPPSVAGTSGRTPEEAVSRLWLELNK